MPADSLLPALPQKLVGEVFSWGEKFGWEFLREFFGLPQNKAGKSTPWTNTGQN